MIAEEISRSLATFRRGSDGLRNSAAPYSATSVNTVLTTKFVDASRSIEDLLLTGVERMANGANIDVQLVRQCRFRLKFVAATADNLDFVILRMNVGFHVLVFDVSADPM